MTNNEITENNSRSLKKSNGKPLCLFSYTKSSSKLEIVAITTEVEKIGATLYMRLAILV